MDEQDFRTRRIAPLLRGDGQAVGCLHGDWLVLHVFSKARLRHCNKHGGRDRRFDKPKIARGQFHRNPPFVFCCGRTSSVTPTSRGRKFEPRKRVPPARIRRSRRHAGGQAASGHALCERYAAAGQTGQAFRDTHHLGGPALMYTALPEPTYWSGSNRDCASPMLSRPLAIVASCTK
jgi:hypothetical protein